MPYRIEGISTRTGKRYISRKTFKTRQEALEWAYSKIYSSDGNTKRRNPPFHSWHIVKVHEKPKKSKARSKRRKKAK